MHAHGRIQLTGKVVIDRPDTKLVRFFFIGNVDANHPDFLCFLPSHRMTPRYTLVAVLHHQKLLIIQTARWVPVCFPVMGHGVS